MIAGFLLVPAYIYFPAAWQQSVTPVSAPKPFVSFCMYMPVHQSRSDSDCCLEVSHTDQHQLGPAVG